MTKRKAIKAGKHERIRKMLNNMSPRWDRFDDNITIAEAEAGPWAHLARIVAAPACDCEAGASCGRIRKGR